MNNMAVMNQVLILFIIAGVGAYARKKGILSDAVRSGITEFVLDITLPLMTIASFNQSFSWDTLYSSGTLVVISFVVHGLSFVLSKYLYLKYPHDMQSVLRYSTVFSNAAFMGYPILETLYGKTGILYASIYVIPFRIFMWSLGVALFTKGNDKESIKNILLNPGIIATVIGLVIFLTPLKFPHIINETFDILGSVTTPLSMIIVGALLADIDLKDIFSGFAVFYCSAVRLIGLPVLVFAVLKFIGVGKAIVDVIVILTAMPAGSMTAILAERYKANVSFASRCVFVSTVLSLITIPLVVMVLK